MMKHALALIALALAIPAVAQTRADRMLDRLPKHYATERAPAYIERVNRAVNALPLTDCKAQAFEKLRRLTVYGINHDRAIFVAVRTEAGEYHAIAVVDRKWALDGRYPEVMTVERLRDVGYEIAPL